MANEPQAPLLSEEEPFSAEELEWFSLRARKHSQHPHLNAEWKQALRDMLRALATIKADRERIKVLEAENATMLSEVTLAHRNSTGTCHCKWCHAYWKARAPYTAILRGEG